jgi:ribonuclease HI
MILVSQQGDKMPYVLWMHFTNASSNEADYETILHGMRMAKSCGTSRINIRRNSNLMV